MQKRSECKKDGQVKGKLDVDSFTNFYPDFVEAEKRAITKIFRFLIDTY